MSEPYVRPALLTPTVHRTYYTVLQIGDVYFRVALDSASSDLWIMGSTCTTSQCTAVPRYPLSYQSQTFGVVNNNATLFKAGYADGTGVSLCFCFKTGALIAWLTAASGFVARESVSLANMTLTDQVFGQSQSLPAVLYSPALVAVVTDSNVTMLDDVSGIMGLGFPRLSGIPSSVSNCAYGLQHQKTRFLLICPESYSLFSVARAAGNFGLPALRSQLDAQYHRFTFARYFLFSFWCYASAQRLCRRH